MRQARIRANLSQRYIAKILGVNQTTLSRYESGAIIPDIIEWYIFCDIVNIPVNLPYCCKLIKLLNER